MAEFRAKFEAKKSELVLVHEQLDPDTVAGTKWKRDTEAMHADGLRLFEEQMKNDQPTDQPNQPTNQPSKRASKQASNRPTD